MNGPVSCDTIGSAVGNRADPKPAAESLVDLLEAAPQVLGFRQDAVGVVEHEPALRGQADKPVAALDDRRPEIVLEQAYRRRQRRLRDVAGLGRASEMLFPGQRGQIFELPQHHGVPHGHIRGAGACQGQ